MDLKLKVLEGKNAGTTISIPSATFIIGRADDCQLRPASDLISRHHCAIIVDGSYVAVRDFGSKNGTFVNGDRVDAECELKHGDRLTVGPLEFQVECAHELGGKKRPPVAGMKEAAARTAEGRPGDVDVTQWIEDEADSATQTSRDTQRVSLSDTDQIELNNTRTFTPESAPIEANADDSTHKSDASGKKSFGKLPPIARQMGKDSGQAAADILNKFRKRR